MEVIPQLFSALIFFEFKKIELFCFFNQKIPDIFQSQKVQLFDFEKCPEFFGSKKFQKKVQIFLNSKKMYFFSELKKKLGYNFDAEIRDISIYEIFRVIPALLLMFWDSFL